MTTRRFASKKPEGQPRSPYSLSGKRMGHPTRGKTASNRLRRVDNFILLYEPSLLTRTDGLFVDLGYGFDARTTLESAARFRRVNPDLPILGVEIDKERVEAALPFSDDKTFFRLGGFNLPLKEGEQVRLIRAFNVLRQYEEADFAPAYERLAEYVLPGGLMIEGTSNPFGSIWAANLARRADVTLSGAKSLTQEKWKMEAIVFSTNFRLGFDIVDFQAVLPKNYIHRMVEGEPIHDFFEAWKRAAAKTIHAKTYGIRQWFISAAEKLAGMGYKVNLQKKFTSRGYLIWEQS